MNLDDCIEEAAKAGVSYGKLMASKPPAEKKEPQEEHREPVATVKCAYCGKDFPVYDKRRHKYCSEECKQNVLRERAMAAWRAKNEKEENKVEEKVTVEEPKADGKAQKKADRQKRIINSLMDIIRDLMEEDE